MIEIIEAIAEQDFLMTETLADTIWREHYIPLVGKPQIDYMLEKFQSAKAMQQQVAEGMTYFNLFYNQNPVGYIAIKPETECLFLSKIYVLKDCRGKGIAKIAMQFVEEQAKTYGLKCIRLTVNINNHIAITAYEKLGFINSGPIVADIGNGFIMDDYEMRKVVD
ncbi:GNAT family N-acetyltransferase [Aestuariibaculum suncheonense]|uniref:GNAT family N-acetyltransferase n=1 Tax=Aestuariibaculum suncheonense TaxID=1028745 RepID=A0A8J6QH75_9FLAO|nr:GNAT family N-acetyltransferase [Aestuariibaculum suncheonense]MBD0835737.1 GNAT family N-acetyltransferase [Aestuariibaculum suncheonense]